MKSRNAHSFKQVNPNQAGSHLSADLQLRLDSEWELCRSLGMGSKPISELFGALLSAVAAKDCNETASIAIPVKLFKAPLFWLGARIVEFLDLTHGDYRPRLFSTVLATRAANWSRCVGHRSAADREFVAPLTTPYPATAGSCNVAASHALRGQRRSISDAFADASTSAAGNRASPACSGPLPQSLLRAFSDRSSARSSGDIRWE